MVGRRRLTAEEAAEAECATEQAPAAAAPDPAPSSGTVTLVPPPFHASVQVGDVTIDHTGLDVDPDTAARLHAAAHTSGVRLHER